jgi:hypothetical protein
MHRRPILSLAVESGLHFEAPHQSRLLAEIAAQRFLGTNIPNFVQPIRPFGIRRWEDCDDAREKSLNCLSTLFFDEREVFLSPQEFGG